MRHAERLLLLLQQNQLAWEAFERSTLGDGFDLRPDRASAMLSHYSARAARRLGRREEARRLWQEALAIDPGFKRARANLAQANREGRSQPLPEVFEFHQALPIGWVKALCVGGDQTLRTLVGLILKHRAKQSDTGAVWLLKELAALPAATEGGRFGFMSFLPTERLFGRDEPVEYWDGERLQGGRVTGTEIYREANESDLPADLEVLLNEGIVFYSDGQPGEAEKRFDTILQRVPDHSVALGNLAVVRSMQGRKDEAVQLVNGKRDPGLQRR